MISETTLQHAKQQAVPEGELISRALSAWFAEPPSRLCDLACLSAAMLAMVLWEPVMAHQNALADLLAMRISTVNLLAGLGCLLLWNTLLNVTKFDRGYTRLSRRLFGLALQICACTGLAGWLLLIRHPNMANFSTLGRFAALSTVLLILVRVASGGYQSLIRPAIRKPRCVLIVGSGQRGQSLAQQLLQHPRWNYRFHGFIDSSPPERVDLLLGGIDSLEAILMGNAIDEVIIALPVKSKYDDIQESISICERVGVQSRFSTDLFNTRITKRRSFDRDDPSAVLLHMVHNETGRAMKRGADIMLAGLALLLLSPVMLIVAISIRLTSKGPILFRQQRYGLNRRLFTMYKFRSMAVDAELRQDELEHLNENAGPVFKIKRDPRITPVGRFIRKASIDELPQLWNVLIGEMSLVGPRPLPTRDVSKFSEAWLMRRFSVLPGITGLWQVSGRSDTTFGHLIKLDLDYIDQWSLLLDLKILAKTFPAVLKGSGAA